jgi:mannose-1-phosphate guanylyltransferase
LFIVHAAPEFLLRGLPASRHAATEVRVNARSDVDAVILVGGQGTRLRPLTESVPKAVLPLAGRPFLRYMLDWLGRHGVEEAVLCCGYRADAVREVLGEGTTPRLRYVEEPEPRGTGGAIRFAAEQLEESFFALNGDVLSDFDLTALRRFHEHHRSRATLGLYPVDNASGYGLVRRDGAEVIEFAEKPPTAVAGEINAGTYVLERSLLDLIPEDREVSIERETFPRLIGAGLHALALDGYWMDVGTPDRYAQATWDVLEGRVETAVGEGIDGSRPLLDDGAVVDPDATVRAPALVERRARIAAGATIGPRAVIGPGCEIGAGARVESSVLHSGCRIGEGAAVIDAIAGAEVEVAAGAKLGPGAVVGAGERIG